MAKSRKKEASIESKSYLKCFKGARRKPPPTRKEINMEYKGLVIEFNIYGAGEYTVQYCGDDILFDSEQEAKEFIEEVTK